MLKFISVKPMIARKQGFLRVSLQLHKWREDEAPKAPREVRCGEGLSPPHRGRGLGRGCAPPQKNF